MEVNKILTKSLEILGCFVCLMFGSDGDVLKFVYALCIFILFDLATGMAKAITLKTFKSTALEEGILKKVVILGAISFCYFIDKFNILNAGISLESVASVFFVIGEMVSTMENFADMGLKLPQQIIDVINKKAGDFVGK